MASQNSRLLKPILLHRNTSEPVFQATRKYIVFRDGRRLHLIKRRKNFRSCKPVKG
jgi:hypothetical protein